MSGTPLPMVRLVVLNWNSGPLLQRCLDSLQALDWPPDRLEVVVVDNDSTDGSADGLDGRTGVRLIRNDHNQGFSANNLALEDLEGIDLVGLVNPDVVVGSGWLTELASVLQSDGELGAACPKILLGDGSGPRILQNAGSSISRDGNSRDRGYGEPDGPLFDEPRDVDAWCGAAVLFRTPYLLDVGAFEERLFLYYEDTDLSWRGANRGWRYRFVPDAECWHIHGAVTGLTTDAVVVLQARNRLLVATRNAPWPQVVLPWIRVALSIPRALVGVGRRPTASQRARAFAAACRHLPWAVRTRRRVRPTG